MKTVRLNVEGMSCSHCQAAVEKALQNQGGVRSATVHLQEGAAEVEFDPAAVSPEQLAAAVTAEGYRADVV
ncbi:MAG TPA: cation transporter [Longimicrobium sp.]|nr:cation transporter [Longimicrobium sp.]